MHDINVSHAFAGYTSISFKALCFVYCTTTNFLERLGLQRVPREGVRRKRALNTVHVQTREKDITEGESNKILISSYSNVLHNFTGYAHTQHRKKRLKCFCIPKACTAFQKANIYTYKGAFPYHVRKLGFTFETAITKSAIFAQYHSSYLNHFIRDPHTDNFQLHCSQFI